MTQRSGGPADAERQEHEEAGTTDSSGQQPTGDDPAVDDPGNSTGQVLGRSVPVRRDVAQAAPGSPETGAVRNADGSPSAEKPYT
ncbi:hypothetical protein O7626_08885 [Micromonospora sp. WMMD1102]|uniref:hypothetical protein n=1 Tax=Micromonospora sp. WMMD1102 TaxID=3016105 RepID=UPI0024157301|nr:hypothetical protein [Micromonospora sp. WMMD1102]MDG4786038.1 hypothetical protein [Micromonospora sp. WMMD1102]